jgi:hypothetical protein
MDAAQITSQNFPVRIRDLFLEHGLSEKQLQMLNTMLQATYSVAFVHQAYKQLPKELQDNISNGLNTQDPLQYSNEMSKRLSSVLKENPSLINVESVIEAAVSETYNAIKEKL